MWQASSTEVWIYRNNSTREAIVSFRGTSDPKDMLTDAAMSLSAFSPGQRPDSRSPEEVADSLSDEELENGPLGGIFKGIKVTCPCQLLEAPCTCHTAFHAAPPSVLHERRILMRKCRSTRTPAGVQNIQL